MAVRDYSVIKKEQDELLAKQKQADKDAQNKIFDTNKKTITDNYTQSIKDGEAEYEDDYRENAVQKKVNEFYISEEMANMGLTNSGLNRTQMTATQLSYANNKAEIDRKRQSMVDSLKREMTNKLTENENSRTSKLAAIDSGYEELATKNANDIYKSEWEAENERLKAEMEAETERQKAAYYSSLASAKPQNIINSQDGMLSRGYEGSLSSNKVSVTYNLDGTTTYLDRVTGYSSTFKSSTNPYTNDDNSQGSSDTAKAWKKYSYFDNGYQPKGIYYNGVDYGWVSDSDEDAWINGNWQNVHKSTVDGSLWIWDATENRYRPYERSE